MGGQWEDWVREAIKGRHLRDPKLSILRKAVALRVRLERSTSATGWLVELLFDSAAQPLPAGVRGGATQRRLLYEARKDRDSEDVCQLDLRLRREKSGTVEITGQMLPPPVDRAWVQATAGKVRRKRSLGESGEFVLRGLPQATESIRVEVLDDAGSVLVIPGIPLPNNEQD